jgi:hypothetical protein
MALMVGGVSSTMVLTEEDRLAAEEVNQPVVAVQVIQAAEKPAKSKI